MAYGAAVPPRYWCFLPDLELGDMYTRYSRDVGIGIKSPERRRSRYLNCFEYLYWRVLDGITSLSKKPSNIMLRYLLLVVTLQRLASYGANGAKVCHVVTHSGGLGPVHT